MARGENSESHDSGNGNVPAAAAASGKQAWGERRGTEGQSVVRWLRSELMALMMGGDLGVSAFPEGDNIFQWVGIIDSFSGTAYEGISYHLTLTFPNDYPYKPPKVRFNSPYFHPNVDTHGNICLDILPDKWSSAGDVRTIPGAPAGLPLRCRCCPERGARGGGWGRGCEGECYTATTGIRHDPVIPQRE